jgi:hypothetical protein
MRSFRQIVSFLPREHWIVVGWLMAIKLLLFYFGTKSYPVLWDKSVTSPHQWFEIWNQWGFGYYQKIAEFGYSGTDGFTAFYPLFPWLVHLVFPIFILFALLGRNRFCAGILTVWSLLLFALFAVLFARGEWAF